MILGGKPKLEEFLCHLPGVTSTKPGSATKPLFGVKPVIVDQNNNILEGPTEGSLCLDMSWPGKCELYMVTINDLQKHILVRFLRYFTGDGCRRDKDGYYWITGRVDDVINISVHRMGTAEVESSC